MDRSTTTLGPSFAENSDPDLVDGVVWAALAASFYLAGNLEFAVLFKPQLYSDATFALQQLLWYLVIVTMFGAPGLLAAQPFGHPEGAAGGGAAGFVITLKRVLAYWVLATIGEAGFVWLGVTYEQVEALTGERRQGVWDSFIEILEMDKVDGLETVWVLLVKSHVAAYTVVRARWGSTVRAAFFRTFRVLGAYLRVVDRNLVARLLSVLVLSLPCLGHRLYLLVRGGWRLS